MKTLNFLIIKKMYNKIFIKATLKDGFIFRVRKDMGLSQDKLAKLCGVTNTYIRLVEVGATTPTDEMQNKILQAIGVVAIVKGFIKELKK